MKDKIQDKDDAINPAHYKHGNLQVIDILKDQLTPEELKGFYKGLVIKYICRADYKNGLEDYKKARWYLDDFIKGKEEGNN